MRKLTFLLMAMVVVFSACKQGEEEKDGKKKVKPSERKELGDTGEKHTFEAADGSFEVSFPGEPDKSEEPVSVSGVDVKKHTIGYGPTPAKQYNLVYLDFPEDQFKGKDPMKVLNAQKDGIIQNLGGRFDGQEKLDNDYPGLKFKAKTGTLYGVYHLYLYKDRLYQLSIVQKDDYADDTSFLKSFKLKNS